MFYTYIIQSVPLKRYYIGSTSNITERLKQHNTGYTKTTRNHGPYILIYVESYNTRGEAIKREKEIKRYKHGNAFKKLITNNNQETISSDIES